MIFLFIDSDGNIETSNTRWNHETNGLTHTRIDDSFTKSDIARLLHANFDEIFSKTNIKHNNIEICGKACNGLTIIEDENHLHNVMNDKKQILSKIWFDYVSNYDFKDSEFAKIVNNDKENLIDKNGNLLLDKFVDVIISNKITNNCIIIRVGKKYNIVNTKNGEFLSNNWFDGVSDFYCGNALIKMRNKYNFISAENKLLSPSQWFDNAEDFKNGFARVWLNRKVNFIKNDGSYLSDVWFDNLDSFKNGVAGYQLSHRFNFIDTTGKVLLNKDIIDFGEYINKSYELCG
jgi:hypothetical protein